MTTTTQKVPLRHVVVNISYMPGTRHAESFSVTLDFAQAYTPPSGGGTPCHSLVVECTPAYPFFMSGVGYNDASWGHGIKHVGPDPDMTHHHRDTITTYLANRNHVNHCHIQEVSRATGTWKDVRGRTVHVEHGVGFLEQMVLGRHDPSGFVRFYDT
jgi:hypothetical protein